MHGAIVSPADTNSHRERCHDSLNVKTVVKIRNKTNKENMVMKQTTTKGSKLIAILVASVSICASADSTFPNAGGDLASAAE